MKILYLSCHGSLEYDEVKLFRELGHEVFSLGVYKNPNQVDDPNRPALPGDANQRFIDLTSPEDKNNIPQEIIDWADIVICMHVVDWLGNNWEKMKGKRVIWRSIGQSTLNVEEMLRGLRANGLEIVRYSPRESTIPGNVGADATIRFYKDPDEFKGWTGNNKRVLTVGQSMKERDQFCNFSLFEQVTKEFPRTLYGKENQAAGELWGGQVSYEKLKELYREHAVYFYTGTYPASYTLNFIEAWMTGIPVVALGRRLGESPFEEGQSTYEVPDFFDKTQGGLYSDDPEELKKFVKMLLEDRKFAELISKRAIEGSIEIFGKTKIKEQWRNYLNG